jgi:hypothetical protein
MYGESVAQVQGLILQKRERSKTNTKNKTSSIEQTIQTQHPKRSFVMVGMGRTQTKSEQQHPIKENLHATTRRFQEAGGGGGM